MQDWIVLCFLFNICYNPSRKKKVTTIVELGMNKLSSNLGFSNIVDLSRGASMPTSFFWKKMVEEMLLLLKSMIKRKKTDI